MSSGRREGNDLLIDDDRYRILTAKYSSADIGTAVGPGLVLSAIIYQITGQESKNCTSCSEHARQMNEWGWLGCWHHRHEIVQWLIEEASKLGYEVDGNIVVGLLSAAIKEHFKRD
jgi:hypothetical protein